AAGTAQQLQIPQPPWYVQFRQKLARLRRIFFSLMAKVEPTSDVEEVEAVCIAILACADAFNALRRTAWELATAKQTP
uniref:Transposase n=1 Tax=Mesocestoides corti TaxID=53468 RepID=A0A5K3FYH9_MESCO